MDWVAFGIVLALGVGIGYAWEMPRRRHEREAERENQRRRGLSALIRQMLEEQAALRKRLGVKPRMRWPAAQWIRL